VPFHADMVVNETSTRECCSIVIPTRDTNVNQSPTNGEAQAAAWPYYTKASRPENPAHVGESQLFLGSLGLAVLICGVASGAVHSPDRIVKACTVVDWAGFGISVSVTLISMVVLMGGFGCLSGFLERPKKPYTWWTIVTTSIRAAIAPGILEEVLWRGLFLPHPAVDSDDRLMELDVLVPIAAANIVLFVLYHLIGGWALGKAGRSGAAKAFQDVRFLILTTILGIACTSVYYFSGGCVWAAAFVHWAAVVVWLCVFNGEELIGPQDNTDDAQVARV